MDVQITAHSWIANSLVEYLNEIGVSVHTHVVDPDGEGYDVICASMPIGGGWTKKILSQRIESCDIPTRMFTVD